MLGEGRRGGGQVGRIGGGRRTIPPSIRINKDKDNDESGFKEKDKEEEKGEGEM